MFQRMEKLESRMVVPDPKEETMTRVSLTEHQDGDRSPAILPHLYLSDENLANLSNFERLTTYN